MQKQAELGTAPVGKLLTRLAIPAITAQLVNMLYNLVDRVYIGHLPEVDTQALTGVGGYFVSYAPVLHGIPVVGGIGMAFEESAVTSPTLRRMLCAESRYIYMMYAEDYCSLSGLNIWEESSVKAEDMPLCAFEKIAQTIERSIENGTIETVHDIRLGYVVYMDETAEGTDDAQTAAYAAVPTWCVSVQYSGKWKDKGWMMMNAQTGEAYAYSSQNISDWYAPIVGEN